MKCAGNSTQLILIQALQKNINVYSKLFMINSLLKLFQIFLEILLRHCKNSEIITQYTKDIQ